MHPLILRARAILGYTHEARSWLMEPRTGNEVRAATMRSSRIVTRAIPKDTIALNLSKDRRRERHGQDSLRLLL